MASRSSFDGSVARAEMVALVALGRKHVAELVRLRAEQEKEWAACIAHFQIASELARRARRETN